MPRTVQSSFLHFSGTAYGLCVVLVALSCLIGRLLPADRLIFLSDRDGTLKLYGMDIHRRLSHKLNDVEMSWNYTLSPDGQQVAYPQWVIDHPEIVIMSLDGRGAWRLVDLPGTTPAWSPDSQFLAFTTLQSANSLAQIYRVRADGADLKPLTRFSADESPFSPMWSPDGTQILFETAAASDVFAYVVNADGTAIRQLSAPASATNVFYPRWSPDGRRIAFTAQPLGDDGEIGSDVLCIAEVNAAVVRCFDHAIGGIPVWSPDGTHIAYVSNRTLHVDLNTVNVETGETRLVFRLSTEQPAFSLGGLGNLLWSPDGSQIIYEVYDHLGRDHSTQLYRINADGTDRQRLTDGASTNVMPVWWPG